MHQQGHLLSASRGPLLLSSSSIGSSVACFKRSTASFVRFNRFICCLLQEVHCFSLLLQQVPVLSASRGPLLLSSASIGASIACFKRSTASLIRFNRGIYCILQEVHCFSHPLQQGHLLPASRGPLLSSASMGPPLVCLKRSTASLVCFNRLTT